MAKEPLPGRVKTRLCPPLDPQQAAAVAEAALADTLEAVAASGAHRKIVALDGRPGSWLPPGFEVFLQRGNGLGERLTSAWSDAGGPGIQIGMDTPQVRPDLIDAALARLEAAPAYRRLALLGPAVDGGWWSIAFPHPVPGAFDGVPMSTAHTGRLQAERLGSLGWEVELLEELRDIDTVEDLTAVASGIPDSRLAAVVAAVVATRPLDVAAPVAECVRQAR